LDRFGATALVSEGFIDVGEAPKHRT
jgi:hypothetical protein